MTRQKIVDKVRKLRALAHGSGTTEAEQELYLRRLGDLMLEHQITESELVKQEGFQWNILRVAMEKRALNARMFYMLDALGRLCNVRVAFEEGGVLAIGVPDALEVFNETGDYLMEQISETLALGISVVGEKGADAFLDGVLTTVGNKIETILAERKHGGTTALVVVELDKFMDQHFTTEEVESVIQGPEVTLGMLAGEVISIRKEVE